MHGLNQSDYAARHYDPAYIRFTTMDPMMEKYYSISPYVYVANNPMKFVDPTGMEMDDYYTEDLKHLGKDDEITSNARIISEEVWNWIQRGVKSGMPNNVSRGLLQASSKLLKIEQAENKFQELWNTGNVNKNVGFVVYNKERKEINFEFANVESSTPEQATIVGPQSAGQYLPGKGLIIGGFHTHPTEAGYIGSIAADTNQPIDNNYNFNRQYSYPSGDGRIAARRGSTYTISETTVNYYSPQGKSSSIPNISTRSRLQNNGFNLLKDNLERYGGKK